MIVEKFSDFDKEFIDGKVHSEIDYYREIWWTTNEKFSWSQRNTIIKKGILYD